jgi:hypothetical protein
MQRLPAVGKSGSRDALVPFNFMVAALQNMRPTENKRPAACRAPVSYTPVLSSMRDLNDAAERNGFEPPFFIDEINAQLCTIPADS